VAESTGSRCDTATGSSSRHVTKVYVVANEGTAVGHRLGRAWEGWDHVERLRRRTFMNPCVVSGCCAFAADLDGRDH
jgi:hypothetical protein